MVVIQIVNNKLYHLDLHKYNSISNQIKKRKPFLINGFLLEIKRIQQDLNNIGDY